MNCIYCSSRAKLLKKSESEGVFRRELLCISCKRSFVTYERAQIKSFVVVKKDGRREDYHRSKISGSISKACIKCDVHPDTIIKIVESIENRLFAGKKMEVKTSQISSLVMSHLKNVNKVAYVRFASNYKDFSDNKINQKVKATPIKLL
jgi:transcriptional repressor NrdR